MITKIKAWLHSPYRWVVAVALLGVLASAWAYHASSREASAVLISGLLASTLFSLIAWANIRQRLHQARLTEDLEESESRFRQLAENINVVFWVNTPDWRQVLYISPAYQHIWGRSAGSLYADGMDWFNAVLEDDRLAVQAKIPANTEADWQTIDFPPYRIVRPDGSLRWISAQAYPVRDNTGKIVRVAGIAEDITERQAYQQHLEELAHYDPLTHLPNRRLLADRMHLALARSHRTGQLLAICMLDLDGFKPVNDKLGHKVGDQLLVEVAQRLQDSVRGDDTAARIGGDEFILLLGGLVSAKEADEALTRILQILAAPYPLICGHPIVISASIGVTLYPDDASDPDTLLRHADHAMYLAKEAGKNRFHLFNPAIEQRERDNRETLRLIGKAAEEDRLTLFYQPIVDCRQGLVVGMEALLRWNHPSLGLMVPAEFLPLIEGEDDLANSVGEWVLRHALSQARAWRRAGLNVPVSVNVFVQQLRDPKFPELLQRLLAEQPELPANSLTIEIVESTALKDFASVVHLMEISADLGVRYALDNFGTGFSSLTYLRRLPVSSLKIDPSFVHEMLQDPENLAIVEGVIGLATAFRHQAIAEGVESIEHTLILMEMGCHLVQGFGIARPMPGDTTIAWLENFRPDPRWLENAAQRLSRDDFQLVLAEVNHRQWLGHLQNWLRLAPENRGPSPPLDKHKCNFGRWYYSEGGSRYGHLAAFRNAESLHDRIHHLAENLVQLNAAGDNPASRQAEIDLSTAAEQFRAVLGEIRAAVKHKDAGQ